MHLQTSADMDPQIDNWNRIHAETITRRIRIVMFIADAVHVNGNVTRYQMSIVIDTN